MATTWRWKIAQWAEIRWWENYLKKKDKHEYAQWKSNYWTNLLGTLGDDFKVPKGASVLDAGCGPSGIFTIFPNQKVTAIDPLLNQYTEKLAYFDKTEYPYVDFICTGLEAYQAKKSFDVVCCMNVINHVKDIAGSTDNLVASLKSGGQLLLTIDAHNYGFFKHIFRALPGDILHPHQYDLAEYEDMLTKRGLTILKTVLIQDAFFFDHYLILAEKS